MLRHYLTTALVAVAAPVAVLLLIAWVWHALPVILKVLLALGGYR